MQCYRYVYIYMFGESAMQSMAKEIKNLTTAQLQECRYNYTERNIDTGQFSECMQVCTDLVLADTRKFCQSS